MEEAAGAKYEPKFGCACFSGYDRGAEGGGGGGGGARGDAAAVTSDSALYVQCLKEAEAELMKEAAAELP